LLSPWLQKGSTLGNDVVYNLPYTVVTELSEIVAVSVESQKVFPGGVGYQVNILLIYCFIAIFPRQAGWVESNLMLKSSPGKGNQKTYPFSKDVMSVWSVIPHLSTLTTCRMALIKHISHPR